MAHLSEENRAKEEKFQKDNQWYSFTTALYNSVGMATFFGLLGMLAKTAVDISIGGQTAAQASLVLGGGPLAVIGGLMVIGVACTYMAQREASKLKSIQDTHLAEENARCVSQGKAPAKDQAVEYDQNCRSDGKQWQEAVANRPELVVSR